jgi:beta-lactam-binding protein with PASTA domain
MPWRRRRVTHEEVVQARPPRPVLWPWLLLLLLLVAALIIGAVWLTTRDTRPKVPDVVGQNTPSAVRELRDTGYVPDVRTRRTSGPLVGRVVSQDPDGGSRLRHGKPVTIVAAIGAVRTGVPTVVGLPVDQAFVRLQAAGFKGSTKKVASPRPRDTVLRQSPAGGSQAAKGSLVQLTISKGGKGQATVPGVVGLTESAATAKLGAAGFRSKVTRTASGKPKGLVNSQSPVQGEKAARGSIVALSVSAGPSTTTGTTSTTPAPSGPKVPRVIGMGQAQAFTRLEQAGFRVDSFPVTSSRTRGLVVRQSPQAGTRARPRSVVRLSVSLGPGARPFRVVPDVGGMREDDAKRVLVRVGFTARALLPANDTQGNVVVDQKPNAGARVRAGSQVAIYLGVPTQ